MVTRKSVLFAVGLLVITVWIWGSATLALSETVKCKCEAQNNILKMVGDSPGNSFGTNETEGSCTCDNGDAYTYKEYNSWSYTLGIGGVCHGFGVNIYKDDSQIVYEYKSLPLKLDPTGEAQLVWEGAGEYIRGTKRFNGIKGSFSTKGKQFAGMKQIGEVIQTYTLPTK